jgi:acyl carrier protein
MTYEEALSAAQIRQGKCRKVKEMIVERLELPVEPDWITDDQALIGRGLELDSVDTLELMIGMEAEFGVTLMDDEVAAFGSVSRLVDRSEADEPLDPSFSTPGGS